MTHNDHETTMDSLLQGRLKILQKKKGFRFSIDAAILAHHVRLKGPSVAVDLGTGCGIIPLILALKAPSAHIHGIEIQNDLAELARRNVQLNCMEDCITIVTADMKDFRSYLTPGTVDVVFSNPPYRKLLSGRINPDPEKAVARHEIKASVSDVLAAADGLLRPAGRLVVVYPAARLVDLVTQMRGRKLEPKQLRMVHSRESSEAVLAVVEAVKGGSPALKVEAPLVIYGSDEEYTEEVREMIEG
jgi:tRNA1Val (adenine37-N6)-methyltransferase